MGQTRLMRGLREAAIGRPAIAHEGSGEVGALRGGCLRKAAPFENGAAGRAPARRAASKFSFNRSFSRRNRSRSRSRWARSRSTRANSSRKRALSGQLVAQRIVGRRLRSGAFPHAPVMPVLTDLYKSKISGRSSRTR